MRLIFCLVVITTVFMVSCSKKDSNADNKKSTMQVVIEGATGKTAVDAGLKAKKQLQAISAQEKKNLAEVQQ